MTGRSPPWFDRMWPRLMASYLFVVAVGALAVFTTIRLLVPRLFDGRYGPGSGSGAGPGPSAPRGEARAALISSLNTALLVGAVISLAVATVAALIVVRRIVRPIDQVRATTRRLADGHYDERVALPREAELAALAGDVNVLAEALERTEQRRRQLVTDLSHELRSPIGTITGYLEGLEDGVIEPTPETFAELADEARRLERLTADLGLLSRLDEGTLTLHPQALDLADVVRRVAARLGPQYEASNVALTLHPPATATSVMADRDRLVQILTSVVGNALRYTPAGGRVDVSWRATSAEAFCEIVDTGRGLTPGEQEQVFDRFYRGSASGGTPGTGVGLTIARSLARAHGGDLTADSSGQGRGARFTLRLPAA